jgi:hypothetical protein
VTRCVIPVAYDPASNKRIINFSTGPSFAQAMILDQGQLDVNVLADNVAVIEMYPTKWTAYRQ